MSEPPESSPCSEETILAKALAGDHRAWTELTATFNRYLSKIIWRRAADLPDDTQEEVKQELWAAVARRGPRRASDPKETAKHYIRRFLRPALDRVRAAYRPPGAPSRLRNASPEWEAPKVVPATAMTDLEDEASAVEQRRVEARLDAERLLRFAAPLVASAAMLMLNWGLNTTEAARAVGLNRVNLHRRLRALGQRRAA